MNNKKEKFNFTREQKEDMIKAIKNYFYHEREEELGDLAANLFLGFIIDELGIEFYNAGVYDSYKFISDRAEDMLSLQK